MASYQPRDFTRLLGTPGFSDRLLQTHFKLYEGYVKNTNDKRQRLRELVQEEKTTGSEFMETQRRLGWEWNGMRLHEYYFGGMVKGGRELQDGSPLADLITAQHGSFNAWKDRFSGIGGMRGIGWAALYYDPEVGELVNTWIDEHDAGHPTSCQLILIMDVFEHAFLIDYGTDKAGYIKAFFQAVDWRIANARLEAVQQGKPVPVTAR